MIMVPETIYTQSVQAIEALLADNRPFFNPVRLLVIGGSSSEIAGGVIGHNSTYELGEALAKAVMDMAGKHGFAPAFQCCEHLNRAIVVERAVAEKYNYEIVCAVPQPKAGGSLATAAYRMMNDPVLVSAISADAGIDVGLTLIGMHLRRVAVPIRLPVTHIGSALVTAARTRPALIGGERAKYAADGVR
jgi:uncharacterized protein (TIGR01440 family)